jgi:hypothetical protein
MRDRKQILKNLEAIYRESYERAKAEELPGRMAELDNSYMRDQLFLWHLPPSRRREARSRSWRRSVV